MKPSTENRFLEELVHQGFVDRQLIGHAFRERGRLKDQTGHEFLMGQILLRQQLITFEQYLDTSRIVGNSILKCSTCQVLFSAAIDKRTRAFCACKKALTRVESNSIDDEAKRALAQNSFSPVETMIIRPEANRPSTRRSALRSVQNPAEPAFPASPTPEFSPPAPFPESLPSRPPSRPQISTQAGPPTPSSAWGPIPPTPSSHSGSTSSKSGRLDPFRDPLESPEAQPANPHPQGMSNPYGPGVVRPPSGPRPIPPIWSGPSRTQSGRWGRPPAPSPLGMPPPSDPFMSVPDIDLENGLPHSSSSSYGIPKTPASGYRQIPTLPPNQEPRPIPRRTPRQHPRDAYPHDAYSPNDRSQNDRSQNAYSRNNQPRDDEPPLIDFSVTQEIEDPTVEAFNRGRSRSTPADSLVPGEPLNTSPSQRINDWNSEHLKPPGAISPNRISRPNNEAKIGRIFGEYQLYEELGRGAAGAVFRARHPALKIPVAVKILKEDLSTNSKAIIRFRREGELMLTLNHENIVRVFDFGELEGRHYIVMDYINGHSLLWHLNERSLAEKRALHVTECLCRALARAHSKGIVHRDLKPDNILIDEQGRPLLTDFGLAKAVSLESLTQSGVAVGTPFYMSPEQIRAKEAVDHRADIYSLGVLAYQMLTGKIPFKSRSPVELFAFILNEDATPPSELRPQLSPSIDAVLQRAMSKWPKDRYQTAAEFGEDIHDIFEGRSPKHIQNGKH